VLDIDDPATCRLSDCLHDLPVDAARSQRPKYAYRRLSGIDRADGLA
jgi:hypothetical protein